MLLSGAAFIAAGAVLLGLGVTVSPYIAIAMIVVGVFFLIAAAWRAFHEHPVENTMANDLLAFAKTSEAQSTMNSKVAKEEYVSREFILQWQGKYTQIKLTETETNSPERPDLEEATIQDIDQFVRHLLKVNSSDPLLNPVSEEPVSPVARCPSFCGGGSKLGYN